MRQTSRTPFQQTARGYLIAIAATGVVAALRLAVSDTVGNFAPIVSFTVAVMIAAWYGGLRPGLLATALSVMAADYLFVPNRHSFDVPSVSGAVALGMLAFTGALISV